ncbi:MAG: hypothetical protein J6Y33_03110 [Prevotella sp.]|nr:hypothetical protein [Prevotella sp.]
MQTAENQLITIRINLNNIFSRKFLPKCLERNKKSRIFAAENVPKWNAAAAEAPGQRKVKQATGQR